MSVWFLKAPNLGAFGRGQFPHSHDAGVVFGEVGESALAGSEFEAGADFAETVRGAGGEDQCVLVPGRVEEIPEKIGADLVDPGFGGRTTGRKRKKVKSICVLHDYICSVLRIFSLTFAPQLIKRIIRALPFCPSLTCADLRQCSPSDPWPIRQSVFGCRGRILRGQGTPSSAAVRHHTAGETPDGVWMMPRMVALLVSPDTEERYCPPSWMRNPRPSGSVASCTIESYVYY